MEWAQLPMTQLGFLGAFLGVLWLVGWLIAKGHLVPSSLVPRSTLDDVRADRDARVKEANDDADDWRSLYVSECEAHELTRRAHAEETRAALLASMEGAQVAASMLKEVRAKQIEAGP